MYNVSNYIINRKRFALSIYGGAQVSESNNAGNWLQLAFLLSQIFKSKSTELV
jgi:hypothetical protein